MAERDNVQSTQERLLVEAVKHYWSNTPNISSLSTEFAADFALSQLRAAKESGHLDHAPSCTSRTWVEVPPSSELVSKEFKPLPCSCGFAEKWGDLL